MQQHSADVPIETTPKHSSSLNFTRKNSTSKATQSVSTRTFMRYSNQSHHSSLRSITITKPPRSWTVRNRREKSTLVKHAVNIVHFAWHFRTNSVRSTSHTNSFRLNQQVTFPFLSNTTNARKSPSQPC